MGLRPLNKTKQNKYRPKTQIDIDGLGTGQHEEKAQGLFMNFDYTHQNSCTYTGNYIFVFSNWGHT